MFKLLDRPEFTHKVTAHIPVDGGFEAMTFKARFKLLPTSDTNGMRTETVEQQCEFLKQVWVGFADVVDEADEPVLWSDKVRDQMMDYQPVRLALFKSYFDAVSKARAGN